ncbi:transcription factor HES-1-like [Haliotis cracherodii]|uniref:transcription factor HES-1-like n=1 Tax=Haliotis cracherodii TaxID=6455 RepID=UPI0039ED66EA
MHSDSTKTSGNEPRDRKSTKPMMEKRRRARINASLAELKSLLLEAIKKEGARHSKMEKADILEMTVKHLRQMQRQHFTVAAADDPSIMNKYRLGFNECSLEVQRYLTSVEDMNTDVKTKLLDHIACYLAGIETSDTANTTETPSPTSSPPPQTPFCKQEIQSRTTSPPRGNMQVSSVATDVNNNAPAMPSLESIKSETMFSGLQVIPTQLSSGEIAFVLPANVFRQCQTPNYVIPVYAGTSPKTSVSVPSATKTTHYSSEPHHSHTVHRLTNTQTVPTDRSYLPCAAVTPVKTIYDKPETDDSVAKKATIGVHVCRNLPQNVEHVCDEAVWRPW